MKHKLYKFGFVLCLIIVLSDDTVNPTTNSSTSSSIESTFKLNASSLPSFSPLLPLNVDQNNDELAKRRAFVVAMMKEAWSGYVKCAWGKTDFLPLNCTALSHSAAGPRDIWHAMPALWIMGLHDEFNQGRKWIEQKLNFSVHLPVNESFSVFGGAMLSCYALTGDVFFLHKAHKYASIYFKGKHATNSHVINWRRSLLELPYLAHLTGDQWLEQRITQMEPQMEAELKNLNNYYQRITGSQTYMKMLITSGDYLLLRAKRYLQSNQTDRTSIELFYRFLESIKKEDHLTRTKSGLWYIGNQYTDTILVFPVRLCNIGATLAFAAQLLPKAQYDNQLGPNVATQWEMARNITDSCHLAAQLVSEYMMPDRFFNGKDDNDKRLTVYLLNRNMQNITRTVYKQRIEMPTFTLDQYYQQLESYFTLARMTGEQRYRDYAWALANKFYQYLRVPNGYISGVVGNFDRINSVSQGTQSPFFFTNLLYLYLTFTPDNYLPLDKWVLNSAGHPIPICGSGNSSYPNVMCF